MSRLEPAASSFDPASVFAALGDGTRLSLLAHLQDGNPRSISELARGSHLTRQGISRHLAVLEAAGLVESRRHGRESRYVMRPEPVSQARDYLARVSAQWDDAMQRLKAFVEEDSPSR